MHTINHLDRLFFMETPVMRKCRLAVDFTNKFLSCLQIPESISIQYIYNLMNKKILILINKLLPFAFLLH